MSSLAHSSFRNEARLYLLYLAAGVAAIPAGIAYAVLVATGWGRWWTVVPLLLLGLASGLLGRKYIQKQFDSRAAVPTISEAAYNAQGFAFGLRTVGGVAAAASIAVLCAHPPNRLHTEQTNSHEQGNSFVASQNAANLRVSYIG